MRMNKVQCRRVGERMRRRGLKVAEVHYEMPNAKSKLSERININHTCDPNVKAKIIHRRQVMIARRRICKQQEVRYIHT
ncbi:hypothetical protein P170DRAFT_189956 [Aspergillus steynii IBT 23096]|uniref:SET domain-containing protein n=1 Tax=Aspergillus steynii IBT 23096 TaxID=1392250 RepID=A0A2I2G9Q6_9EURO|nr:uncharacterized protein P170DRAFT_189956 [Aspergillus steynii IBT 23096]PLB49611.1 hypothetical protein P170DRAFT_189956 [Aspergillus steynii IBT 23096]